MSKIPFKYGSTVSSESFTNREDEIKKLYENLTTGVNTTIISPRRWGKSSLVEKVVTEIEKENQDTKTIIIDLFSVDDESEFLEIFAREVIKASSSNWEEWVQSGKNFFKHLIPKFNIGIDPINDFSISFDWKDLQKHKNEVLNLPEEIAKQKNIRFIICLDEFQNLAAYPEYETLEKKMRAAWQRHKHVTYCLYGSKRHMMTDIFNNPSKPFYRFGDIILLQKIKTEKWIPYIMNGFRSIGKEIKENMAKQIAQIMKQHPWYVQQLSHYTLQKTEKTATKEQLNQALEELIQANSPLYQKEIESISSTQLNLLKAIAKSEIQLTSSRVMQDYKLGTPRNVSKNREVLMNKDIIHEVNEGHEFLDPAFELWFMNQYFNKQYTI